VNARRSCNSGIDRIALDDRWKGSRSRCPHYSQTGRGKCLEAQASGDQSGATASPRPTSADMSRAGVKRSLGPAASPFPLPGMDAVVVGWTYRSRFRTNAASPRVDGEPSRIAMSPSVSGTAMSAPAAPKIQAHATTETNTTRGLRLNSAPMTMG